MAGYNSHNQNTVITSYLDQIASKDREVLSKLHNTISTTLDIARLEKQATIDFENRRKVQVELKHLLSSMGMVLIKIGESANEVDESIKKANPDMPWKMIRGLRNDLAHYFNKVEESGRSVEDYLGRVTSGKTKKKDILSTLMKFMYDNLASTDPKVEKLSLNIFELHSMIFLFRNPDKKKPGMFTIDPKEEHTLQDTLKNASLFNMLHGADLTKSLSDIFKQNHAVRKNGQGESHFISPSFFERMRNHLAHDNFGQFIDKAWKELAKEISVMDRLPEMIEKKYLKPFHPSKNKYSANGESYYNILIDGDGKSSKKLIPAKIKQIEKAVEIILSEPGPRDLKKEEAYLHEILSISPRFTNAGNFGKVVEGTVSSVYHSTVAKATGPKEDSDEISRVGYHVGVIANKMLLYNIEAMQARNK